MNLTARIATMSAPAPKVLSIALALTVGLLLSLSAQAVATTGHGFADSFGGSGIGNGQFSGGPQGVGVGLSGEVFVADRGEVEGVVNARVERFDGGGAFQSSFPIAGAEFQNIGALAVDSAPIGGVYVTATSAATGAPVVAKFSSTGTFEYTLDPSTSETTINIGVVAIDPSNGTVYTTATNDDTGAQVIDSFDRTTGVLIASFTGAEGSPDEGFGCPSALAADSSHRVYVLDPCKGRADVYSAAGVFEATVDDGSRGVPQALATNPETGEVYVAEAGPSGLQIANFTAAGASLVQVFSASGDEALSAMAVGSDGTVYLGDNANSGVDRFTAFAGPTVTTAVASAVERTAAILNGTIDPGGKASKYHYEYGLETNYGSSTGPVDAGSGSGAAAAPAPVAALVPNTTYHYRIVGSNASGSIIGADQTFTTVSAPPAVDGFSAFASTITPTGARVHAAVNPEHSPSTFRIEYGTTTAYGSIAPEGGAEVGEQSVDTLVAATLTGLEPGTLYHFRVSAEDGVEGPQFGADATFITAPAAPAVGTNVTTRKATLTGMIDPHGSPTTYYFNYGSTTAYGASTPEADGGSGNGEQVASALIEGLSPSTTYHVQVVAMTNGVTMSGADGTFTTPPAPTATVSDPTSVTTSTATLEGAADTHGLPGSYHFEVSAVEGSYSTSTEEQPLPAFTGSQAVSLPVNDLPSGQRLHVRLVVTSEESIGFSEQAAFATAPVPPEGFPAPPSPGSVYGCIAPKLNPYNAEPKPGSSIAVSGSDLGLSGAVLLGEETVIPTSWSATGFTIDIPTDATGTLGLAVNCGQPSNTVAITVDRPPSETLTVSKIAVKSTTARFSVKLPGAGTLQATGGHIKSTTTRIAASGTHAIEVKLSNSGVKALAKAKHGTLAVKVRLRFTATGGKPVARTITLAFKHKAGH